MKRIVFLVLLTFCMTGCNQAFINAMDAMNRDYQYRQAQSWDRYYQQQQVNALQDISNSLNGF